MMWAVEHPRLALAVWVALWAAAAVAVAAVALAVDGWWQRRTAARRVVAEAEAVVFEAAARIARAGGL